MRHRAARAVRLGRVVAILAASVIALVALPLGSAVASSPSTVTCSTSSSPAPSEGGVDMSATIVGPATSPCDAKPSGTVSGGSGPAPVGTSTRQNGPGTGAGVDPAGVVTDGELPSLTLDEVDLGGMLSIGGLSTSYRPSFNPFGGDLELSFTVRNTSQSTVDATADFWMEGPFGLRISSADDVAVAALKPGETRTVSASLPGVGQWTVLTAHTTFTPPEMVDDVQLTPLTRDATVFALPWFVVLLVALGLAAWVVVLVLRRREGAEPIGAWA
ncbi:hypothetical protein DEA06_10290 [Microbacterium sp. Gd 4-13]|uniref:hypothetical protein n=1 Tax=Microbacterium sp. Gd 4-13 TaxID=2173179 RepID=UPI000D5632D4|nr:hypothetical protein [Microbacterium sp. Gd 4-13]PVW04384.1 hypothetical protein DEA06_10290 [Microbacterium sp. Gd 4-13]